MAKQHVTSLCAQGVKLVKAGHTNAATVAVAVLKKRWTKLPDQVKRHLAALGLARLINDDLAAERARQAQEERQRLDEYLRPEREQREALDRSYQEHCARAAERVAEMRRQDAEKLKDAPPLEEVVERVHDAFQCTCKTHQRSYKLREKEVFLFCHGDPRLLTKAKLAAVIAKVEEMYQGGHRRMMAAIEEYGDRQYARATHDLRSIMLVAADGTMKPLLDFSLDDVRAWQKKSTANTISWKKRKAFFSRMERVLTGADVANVCDLPAEAIRKLAREARAVWKTRKLAGAA
jgi:hypothetical protein